MECWGCNGARLCEPQQQPNFKTLQSISHVFCMRSCCGSQTRAPVLRRVNRPGLCSIAGVGLICRRRSVRQQFHETDPRLPSHQAGRPALAAVEPDEDPERGLSGANRERESRRAALAVAAPEREHSAQASRRRGTRRSFISCWKARVACAWATRR